SVRGARGSGGSYRRRAASTPVTRSGGDRDRPPSRWSRRRRSDAVEVGEDDTLAPSDVFVVAAVDLEFEGLGVFPGRGESFGSPLGGGGDVVGGGGGGGGGGAEIDPDDE
ncbi:unnamed protein product, partial [Ectocarpus sp. 12 AP-2014]